MLRININYTDPNVKKYMFKGFFGLEKESLRVDINGFTADTAHPFENNPNIDRDFCENQTEIITDVCGSIEEVCGELERLHKTAVDVLWKNQVQPELLWPFSNPPYIRSDFDIPIANFSGKLKSKEIYRHYLAKKYGKRKMLYSGIHFNFSFSREFLDELFKNSAYSSFSDYKNAIYLDLEKKLTKYSWLVVYLTAASSVMDGSYIRSEDLGKDIFTRFSSSRCSSIGYWNDFVPLLEYDSLDKYVKSIRSYIDDGQIISPSELYYPVRLKPAGENSLESLLENGVDHIEFRLLDLNPLSPFGIIEEDIYFLHLLIIYLISLDSEIFDYRKQNSAINNIKKSAEYDDERIMIEIDNDKFLPVKQAAYNVLNAMEEYYNFCDDHFITKVIEYQKEKISDEQKRYAFIVREKFGHHYVESGLRLARSYAEKIERESR